MRFSPDAQEYIDAIDRCGTTQDVARVKRLMRAERKRLRRGEWKQVLQFLEIRADQVKRTARMASTTAQHWLALD